MCLFINYFKMRKIAASKSKKGAPVKEEQRITSFFNKLVVHKTSKSSNNSNNKKDEQPSGSKSTSKNKVLNIDDEECCTTIIIANKDKNTVGINIKISPNKKQIEISRATKKKTPVKQIIRKSIKSLKNDTADSSDSDFVTDKKEKVKSNLLVAFKSKHKLIYDKNATTRDDIKATTSKSEVEINKKPKVNKSNVKDNKEVNLLSPPITKNESSPNKDSQLIVDLETKIDLKNDLQTPEELFAATPEKTYLQRDEILADITHSSNCLDIAFQNDSKSLSRSPPHENIKKRKFEIESPGVIPSTPQELLVPQKMNRLKSKLCIENKFPKIEEEPVVEIRNIVFSPPKKRICVSDNENRKPDQILKLSPINSSTTNFNVTPVKCISPSKSSLHKGEKLKIPVSPSKSNHKFKRTLFDLDVGKDFVKIIVNPLLEPLVSKQIENKKQEIETETIEENQKEISDELDDLFDDDWDVEINQIEDKINHLNLENWQYCKILEVSRDQYQNIILKLRSIENKQETSCILQGVWQYSNLQPDDIINILALKNPGDIPYCVNNNGGFLVFEPDIMISPTSIVGSQFCKRRGILSEKFRGFEPQNKIMIVGTLVHKLLQDVLKKEIYKPALVEKKLMNILSSKDMIVTSYSSQIPIDEIKNELMPFVPKVVNFVEKYVRNDKNKIQPSTKSEDWQGKINSIQDIEENIWCPHLGIKGKVDITIKTNAFGSILPLELKTGRASMSLEHRGQVIMYAMIMTELGYNVSSGLLLYLREDTLREVSASHREKRDLIMLRNEFAYYTKLKPKVTPAQNSEEETDEKVDNCKSSVKNVMKELDPLKQLRFTELPEPINHHNACGKCPYAIICTALLSRDDSYTLSESHPLQKISLEMLEHLNQNHIDYFIHWTSLLSLENSYKPPVKELKDIWRLPPYKRENRGKSICYLKISARVSEQNDSFIHTFTRSTDEKINNVILEKELRNDFIASGLLAGNYIVISTESRCAVATGFIKEISQTAVVVTLERDLTERYSNKTFHLDTYESQQIVNFSTTSVAALLEPTERAKRLRELIIDRQQSIISGDLTQTIVTKGAKILRKLNKIQQRAVLKALTVKDYLLIKGMPGTGKTATIVSLVELLVKLNKTVLVTSHTHSAVDNVCLRLLKCGVEFLRLGSENRVHPQIKHRSESVLTAHCKTVEELQQIYDSAKVVAVTCLAAAHPMLAQRKLDFCIVDESTQVLQCSVIKALLSTKSFILIGDPEQLPPVVRNPEAVRRGMNESLFERLDYLNSTITLTLQYRMNKTITDLANSVTYEGELLCADETVATAILVLPDQEKLQSLYKQEQWILNTLETKLENSVIAIDTGPTWNVSSEQKNVENNLLTELQVAPQNVQEDEERRCSNNYEAAIVITVVKALKEAGVCSNSIGVIAPYRAQVTLLKKLVSKIYEKENCEPVEVNTVDQYQGRDKEVIIYSCTRSRDVNKTKNNTGFEILDDKRRLTVAITRAKHKLIVIGDFVTLKEYSPFKKLLNSLDSHQKLILKEETSGFKWNQVDKHLVI